MTFTIDTFDIVYGCVQLACQFGFGACVYWLGFWAGRSSVRP
jgi:hypothetical protein